MSVHKDSAERRGVNRIFPHGQFFAVWPVCRKFRPPRSASCSALGSASLTTHPL